MKATHQYKSYEIEYAGNAKLLLGFPYQPPTNRTTEPPRHRRERQRAIGNE